MIDTGNEKSIFDKIIAYENGDLFEDEMIDLFQELIDTGMLWQLQGHYGRMAMRLINAGLCHQRQSNAMAAAIKAVETIAPQTEMQEGVA